MEIVYEEISLLVCIAFTNHSLRHPTKPRHMLGKIEIGRHVYDQPIYKQRDGFYMKEYLVGDAFKYTWVEKNKFKDLSDCKDKFK